MIDEIKKLYKNNKYIIINIDNAMLARFKNTNSMEEKIK